MKHVKLYEGFLDEMYFGPGSGFELGKKLAVTDSVVKKLKSHLQKDHEYTFEEIAKLITEHGLVLEFDATVRSDLFDEFLGFKENFPILFKVTGKNMYCHSRSPDIGFC